MSKLFNNNVDQMKSEMNQLMCANVLFLCFSIAYEALPHMCVMCMPMMALS